MTSIEIPTGLTADELRDAWLALDPTERSEGFGLLSRNDAQDFFVALAPREQRSLLTLLGVNERRLWMRVLPPDDAADLIQHAGREPRDELLALLDEPTRREVAALLAYAEDSAGGLMNPRFARLRPGMSADEAIRYLRRQTREHAESIYYVYVLDQEQRLLGVLSFRELFAAEPTRLVQDLMHKTLVTVREDTDQEAVARLIDTHDLLAVPVVDEHGHIKGIITVDDVVDVVREEATEDIQKLGGMEALGAPYLQTPFFSLVRKRAGWLSALFLGEMLTASAMAHFESEIASAVVLALFVPLIISSGGNSGSQATTLVIRAMALGEVRLRDWYRIVQRELGAGLTLGAVLATIGLVRIVLWQAMFHTYGEHYLLVALTVAISIVGVVTWGTVSGSMLPFIIRRLGFDPASASAPFVATLVDVSGLVIYFSTASVVLGGTLLKP